MSNRVNRKAATGEIIIIIIIIIIITTTKALIGDAKHCVLAVVRRSQKNFAPPETPSRGQGTAKI